MESSSYEKYVGLFKKNRSKVQQYEEGFRAKFGRKPSKEDLASAPEHVLVCIKNCKKIKCYLDQKSSLTSPPTEAKKTTVPNEELEISSKSCEAQKTEPANCDTSLNRSKSVWGSHLNKNEDTPKSGLFRRHKTDSAIVSGPSSSSFSGLLSEASQSQQTRMSLKKNPKSRKSSAARNFFGTLGDGGDEDSMTTSTLTSPTLLASTVTEESAPPPLPTKKMVDPLSRFDPEISLLSADDENSDELVFGPKIDKHVDPVKRPPDSGKRQPLSLLSVISSQKPESSRLSFSGLFPKAETPKKGINDDDGDDVDVESSAGKASKRKLDDGVVHVPEAKRSRVDLSHLEHDEAEAERQVDPPPEPKPDVLDPATKELAKTDIYSLGFEDAEDDPRQFASVKPVKSTFAAGKKSSVQKLSENFVKINLKKKNYVRGKKTMTGAKYRRQEWKRKQTEKDATTAKAAKVATAAKAAKTKKVIICIF